jgi:hypothetical protein
MNRDEINDAGYSLAAIIWALGYSFLVGLAILGINHSPFIWAVVCAWPFISFLIGGVWSYLLSNKYGEVE